MEVMFQAEPKVAFYHTYHTTLWTQLPVCLCSCLQSMTIEPQLHNGPELKERGASIWMSEHIWTTWQYNYFL